MVLRHSTLAPSHAALCTTEDVKCGLRAGKEEPLLAATPGWYCTYCRQFERTCIVDASQSDEASYQLDRRRFSPIAGRRTRLPGGRQCHTFGRLWCPQRMIPLLGGSGNHPFISPSHEQKSWCQGTPEDQTHLVEHRGVVFLCNLGSAVRTNVTAHCWKYLGIVEDECLETFQLKGFPYL